MHNSACVKRKARHVPPRRAQSIVDGILKVVFEPLVIKSKFLRAFLAYVVLWTAAGLVWLTDRAEWKIMLISALAVLWLHGVLWRWRTWAWASVAEFAWSVALWGGTLLLLALYLPR